MDKVPVPRVVLLVMGAVLLVSLLAVSFLLGRESTRTAGTVPAPGAATDMIHDKPPSPLGVAAAPTPVAATTPTPPAPPPPPPVAAPPPAPRPAAAPVAMPPAAPHAAAASVDSGERAAVAQYFTRMDNLQPGRIADDPNDFARKLLESAMNGDTSGMDQLVTQARQTRQAAAALQPPAPCREYHRAALSLMDESTQVLGQVREAMRRNDASALTAASGRATALKSRAEALERQEQEIKQRYGLR